MHLADSYLEANSTLPLPLKAVVEAELDLLESSLDSPYLSTPDLYIRSSLIVRNDADLLNLPYPRFSHRAYLPNNQGFVNLRRLGAINVALQSTAGKVPDAELIACAVADSVLAPPARVCDEYAVLTCNIGKDYGEHELIDGTPYVRHMPFGGGLCSQACCWMITALLHRHAKAIYGLSETTFLARDDFRNDQLVLGGLNAMQMCHFLRKECALNAFCLELDRGGLFLSGSEGIDKLCRMYLNAGFPSLLPSLRDGQPHCSVVVGVSHAKRELLINDPAVAPFQSLGIDEARQAQKGLKHPIGSPGRFKLFPVVKNIIENHPVSHFAITSPSETEERVGLVETLAFVEGCLDFPELLDFKSIGSLSVGDVGRLIEIEVTSDHDRIEDIDLQQDKWKTIWRRSEFILIETERALKEGFNDLQGGFADCVSDLDRYSPLFRDCPYIWIQLATMRVGASENEYQHTIWVWDARIPSVPNREIGSARLGVFASNPVIRFARRSLRFVSSAGTLLYSRNRRAKFLDTTEPVARSEEVPFALGTKRTLSPSVITSFSASAQEVGSILATGIKNIELYVMMQQTALQVEKQVAQFLGKQSLLSKDFDAVRLMEKLWEILNSKEYSAEVRMRCLEIAASSSCPKMPKTCSIHAIASYVPWISASPGSVGAMAATKAVAFCLLLAGRLRMDGHPAAVVEIVAGSRIANPRWGNGANDLTLTIEVRDDEAAQSDTLENISRAIDRADEVGMNLGISELPPVALELEPGPLFTLRDVATWNQISRRIESPEFQRLNQRVGFNLDIGHLRIARSQSGDTEEQLTRSACERIINAHISGISRLGHFSDLPLISSEIGHEEKLIVADLLLANQPKLPHSNCVSVELEVCPDLETVKTSILALERFLESF